MKFRIERSFDRDVDGIRDKKLLRKLQAFISAIENADSIQEIPEVILLRFLHRKDIYRYFPKRG